jgi:hypothetical protein
MGVERRKYVRFLAQDNTFAALRIGFKKVGKINDISINGLSFSYLSETVGAGSDRHLTQVDIFTSGNNFHLSNVPCKIVYDIQDPTSGKHLDLMMCRCGLKFNEPTKSQSEQLELFIKNHTTEILSS